ncbi:DUF2142 domain-containing protein [Pantoea sp. BAV 3049]|uniref:DUF2142 domain-containing protein n=1 Tax=Pantoea sp. BAV 3049 TaxID=2654188 RepID=UPI00131B194F|nr:DUF2142 domain-containing protein [Pantoea sp. BAV 3049]
MLYEDSSSENNTTRPDRKNNWTNIILFIIFTLVSFAWVFHVKPPFISPDEGAHLSRADALRNGYIALTSPDGKMNSGGEVDNSMNYFRSQYDKVIKSHNNPELANEMKREMQNLYWSNTKRFYSMANTAFYFPAVYIPQAIGFEVGHILNLNLYSTYKLATTLNLLAIITLIIAAWRLAPIPAPAIAVMLLPMSIFQFFSPTIDGLTFAFTVLTMSLLTNLLKHENHLHFRKKLFLLCIVIFALSSSRANLLPLLFLPLWLFFRTRQRSCLIGFAVTSILVLAWTYFSIKTVHDNGIHHPGIEQIDVLKYYILHPFEIPQIIVNTLSDYSTFTFYVQSLIGKLGWLDAPIGDFAYWGFGLAIYSIFILNISKKHVAKHKTDTVLLLLLTLSIITLTFCALLVQWSAFPTTKVDGVQGRYFIIPFIILGYALMDKPELRKLSYAALAFMAVASVMTVHIALETRYF